MNEAGVETLSMIGHVATYTAAPPFPAEREPLQYPDGQQSDGGKADGGVPQEPIAAVRRP